MTAHPLANKRNRVIFLVCWLSWTFGHFVAIRQLWDLPVGPSLIDTSLSSILLMAIVLLVLNNLRYYRPRRQQYLYLLIFCGTLTLLWCAVVKFGVGAVIAYDPSYADFLHRSMVVRFDIAFLLIGGTALVSMFWYNLNEQQEQEQREKDAQKLAREAELYKLRQQLQPHFLFNSLNSISALVGSKPQEARRMVQQLSDFLRGTLRKEEYQWVSLQDDLQHLGLYLDIEKVRFGHRLNTVTDYDPESLQAQLPPLLLQPLVENAIKFGLYDTTEPITISLSSRMVDGFLEIEVQNPYDPETSSPKRGTGFGLRSVQRRLYLLFARHDLLAVRADGQLFITTVKIPQHDKGIDHR